MTRTLGIIKKISLAGLAEGWGVECYLLASPLTYPQALELKKLKIDPENQEAAVLEMIKLIKERTVTGKVKVYEDGELKLVDLEKDDIDTMSVEMTDYIFSDMSGVKFRDPKDLLPVAASSETQPNSTDTTETS